MRTLFLASAVLASAIAIAIAGAASAAVPGSTGDQLVLFNNQNFQGPSVRLTGDSPNMTIWGVNSVQVRGQTWRICSQPNFTGRCVTVTGDDAHFAARGLPGVRSAMRLDQTSGPGSVASEIMFFNGLNYQGPSNRITGDSPNVQLPWGANSVRVNGQVWQVCSEPNYAGRCATINQDSPHFQSVGRPAAARSVRRLDRIGSSSSGRAPMVQGGQGGSGQGGSGQGGSGQGGSGQGGSGQGGAGQGSHHHGLGGSGSGGGYGSGQGGG